MFELVRMLACDAIDPGPLPPAADDALPIVAVVAAVAALLLFFVRSGKR